MDTGELSGVLTGEAQFTAGVVDAKLHVATASIDVPFSSSSVKILTTLLPAATVGHFYNVTIECNQPGNPCFFSLQGSVPPGLRFSEGNLAVLKGMPTSSGSFTFSVTATVGSSSDQRTYTLLVSDKLPRNDAISSATALSNGLWLASISPYHDSSNNGPDR